MKKYVAIFLLACSSVFSLQAQIMPRTDNALFDMLFSEAVKYKLEGNYQKAFDYYLNCMRLDEKSAVVMYEIATLLYQTGDARNAEKYIDLALKNDTTDNLFYLRRAIDIKVAAKNWEVYELIDKMVVKDPGSAPEMYAIATSFAMDELNYKQALIYLDKLEEQAGPNEYTNAYRYEILTSSGEDKEALKLVKKLYAEHPNVAIYSYLYSDYYLRKNDVKKGLPYLEKATQLPGGDEYCFELAVVYLQLREYEKFKEYSEKGFYSTTLTYDEKFKKLASSLSNRDVIKDVPQLSDYFTNMLEYMMSHYSEEESIYALYAAYCNDLDDREKSVKIYKQYLSKSETFSKAELWRDFIFNLLVSNNDDEVLSYCNQALKYYPNDPLILLFKGESILMKKDYANAIEPLHRSYMLLLADNSENNKQLKITTLSHLGTCYHYTDSMDQCYAMFEEVLKLDPYNVGVLNNYSYFLAVDGKDLDKAEAMSRRAITIEQNNPTYLDTYAWVLYKKKSYTEARFIIERAIDKCEEVEENAEIFDHYGDILIKVDDKEKALKYWELSNKLAPSTDKQKKIDENK